MNTRPAGPNTPVNPAVNAAKRTRFTLSSFIAALKTRYAKLAARLDAVAKRDWETYN